MIIWFFVGMFVGGFLGCLSTALIVAGRVEDERERGNYLLAQLEGMRKCCSHQNDQSTKE